MRRVLPVGCALLLAYGCAGGGSTTDTFTGDDAGTEVDGGAFADGSPMSDGSTSDAPTDSGPPKTCVHNDDCKGPNICSGTNGQACMGGFCVPTGKAQNCDDGVACTDDSCDANANACKHKPNDSACPNNSYCDPMSNCVQTLPCTGPTDTVCDRLNTTACDGTWSCDGMRKYCVRAPKPCLDRANAVTTCTPMGTMATCSWACSMGYVDLNMDLQTMGTSNGCECHATDLVDKPTLANVDGNCDGIVGNIANAIFVDTVSGNDANPGTMSMPKKTIQAGVGTALAANPTKDVYVSKGAYSESVAMADGVSVYGGYDKANGWSRNAGNITTINSPTTVGVGAHNLTKATELQLMSVTSANAAGTTVTGDGQSSYGVVIASCTGGFTVRGCTITPGTGAAAANGANGGTGSTGGVGGSTGGAGAGGAGNGCQGANGGGGAGAPGCTAGGNTGTGGTQVAGGGTAAPGGNPGASGACSTTSSSNAGSAPPVAVSGGQGNPGANGNAGATFGAFDLLGSYLPAIGGDGITTGYPGGGGGGGGSGGGAAHGTNTFCTDCSCLAGGGGGGGGGGGCGGNVGAGGRGGGGSFGIVVIQSTVTVDSCKTTTAAGGRGGNGGNGGGGGGGGGPGTGGAGQVGSGGCSTRSGGNGASGSQGGPGGNGGGGSGGTGGASVCIVYKGTSPTSTNNMCTLGGAGQGGTGGGNGVTAAQNGSTGTSIDTQNSP